MSINNCEIEASPELGVFVGDLALTVTDVDLLNEFQFCEPIRARVVRDKQGMSKKFGFVYFKSAGTCKMALDLDGHFVHGQKIKVKTQHYSNKDRVMIKLGDRLGDLYVGNVPLDIKEHDLECELRALGIDFFTEIRIKTGFCFISFIEGADAFKALQILAALRPTRRRLCGKEILIHMRRNGSDPVNVDANNISAVFGHCHQYRENLDKSRQTIYVQNIGDATKAQLIELFQRFGEVTDCRVKQLRRPGRCARYAFMEFATNAHARHALEVCSQTPMLFGNNELKVQMCRPPTLVTKPLPAGTSMNLYQDAQTGQLYTTQQGYLGASYAMSLAGYTENQQQCYPPEYYHMAGYPQQVGKDTTSMCFG